MISPAQCRAARGWLRWSRPQLEEATGLSRYAVQQFEDEYTRITPDTERAIRAAFEKHGIRFVYNRDGSPLGIEWTPGDRETR